MLAGLEERVVGEARGRHASMQRTRVEAPILVCAVHRRLPGLREAIVLEDWAKFVWLGVVALVWRSVAVTSNKSVKRFVLYVDLMATLEGRGKWLSSVPRAACASAKWCERARASPLV